MPVIPAVVLISFTIFGFKNKFKASKKLVSIDLDSSPGIDCIAY